MRRARQKKLVTIIIPVEPKGDASACLEALRRLKGPRPEILVVSGLQPSCQRNQAVKKAQGTWLLFLDSDSRPEPDLAQRLLAASKALKAEGAGGPNLPLKDEPRAGRWFDLVLSSPFGSGPARARYASLGARRVCGEKELILCNLMLKREAFLALGGFREDLYPNEENEFMNRLLAGGGKLVYEPKALVRRPRRKSVWAFAVQAFRYGRGRMRQVMANFFLGDLLNLAPLPALVYAGLLPWLAAMDFRFLAPALLYLVLDAMASLGVLLKSGDGKAALAALLLFPLRHFAYALGLLAGFVSKGEAGRNAGTIRVQRVRT